MDKKIVGEIGEKLANRYLLQKGYAILQMNYKTKKGEVDIFAKKENKLFGVEVKTLVVDAKEYENADSMEPLDKIDNKKRNRVIAITQEYFYLHKKEFEDFGIIFVSVRLDREGKRAKIDHVEEIV